MGGVGWDVYDDEVSEHNDGMPLSQIALRWSIEKPFVSTCIVGTQIRERILENASSFDKDFSPEDWASLNETVENLK